MSFTDLRRLLELWTAWYSIGVDGWLATDESTHTCSLDLPDPAPTTSSTQPPYPPDPELDALFLRALNEFGLQCSRLGGISFSRTSTGDQITSAGAPIVGLLEGGQAFFSGKRLSIFSELRRDYGDFGSHTMALDLAIEDGHAVIHHASLEMNNRRRGLKLELWEPLISALAAYEEIFEQGAALGHSFTDDPADLADADEAAMDSTGESAQRPEAEREETPQGPGAAVASEPSQQEAASPQRREAAGLPFPCLSQTEANHLARLSSHVAPMRRAVADGTILISTHPLRELAALITFARFCEPLGAMQRV